jgi:hypothetical protein
MRDGEFSVSMTMAELLYTSQFRRKLRAILADTSTPTKNHSAYPGNTRCRCYEFKLGNLQTQKAPTYSGVPMGGMVWDGSADLRTVKSPGLWLCSRTEKWDAICTEHDWTNHLDVDGRTDWGRPIHEALAATLVPVTRETKRLREGVVPIKRRRHGRCYHPLTNLRKDLRRDCQLNGESAVEVDIHACYSAILISQLAEGQPKNRAIEAVQGDWYSQFDGAYSGWLLEQERKGVAYHSDRWMIRVDDDPAHDAPASIKVEYQRQCLFWRDNRAGRNPLRQTLRELHPELCGLIESLRARLTPTDLSHVLTHAEGSLVVDSALAELERLEINAIPIHDAVVVPESKAEQARAVMLAVAEWHLGFRPRITVKQRSQKNADGQVEVSSNLEHNRNQGCC